jgi:hypothetical protein
MRYSVIWYLILNLVTDFLYRRSLMAANQKKYINVRIAAICLKMMIH